MFENFSIFKRNKKALKEMCPQILADYICQEIEDYAKKNKLNDQQKQDLKIQFANSLMDYMYSPDDPIQMNFI